MNGLILALAAALPAASARAAPIRLALIEDAPTRVTLQLTQPLERVLRDAGPDAALLSVESVSVLTRGSECRFHPPDEGRRPLDLPSSAAALEGESELAFVWPAEPSLIAALRAAASDPTSYRSPASLDLTASGVQVSTAVHDGRPSLTLRARLRRPLPDLARPSLAAYYRLRWRNAPAAVLVVGRLHGGLGRLGAAARDERTRGPYIGLARGGTFGSASSEEPGRPVAEALERAGLLVSAVSASEIEHWEELDARRRERPSGTRWLSANLVYSSAPAATILPPYAVVEASGARVAVVGLTPPWTERLLKSSGLGHLTVADPFAAVERLLPRLRTEADVVVVLSELPMADQTRMTAAARGVDLVIGDNAAFLASSRPPTTVLQQEGRVPFSNPFPVVRSYAPALNIVEIDRLGSSWRVTQSARLLDDSVVPEEGYPEAALETYASASSSAPALLPDARAVFPPKQRAFPVYEPRDFWTLASVLLSEKAKAEAAVLLAPALGAPTLGGVREPYVRDWLGPADPAAIVAVKGDRLKLLHDEAADQARKEAEGRAVSGRPRFVVGGLDALKRARGAPLDPSGTYRVATSRATADALALPEPREPVPGAPFVNETILDELRRRAGTASPDAYRAWMSGLPLSEPGLWRLNFRDVGLNLRQTRVVRPDEFDAVPNTRIQGFDELLVGGVFKADAEYLKREFKWTNTAEGEYAKSRLTPRDAPQTTNLAANRLMLRTLGTRRAGGIPREWLARSWGPSLGFQYDGEFEAAIGLKRKNVYSLLPGVELFDGTFVRSLEMSGIVKRDLSREPPNTQTGLRWRSIVSREIGPSKALLQAELWNNYFFLTRHDAPGDLRLEGDVNVKLRLPVRKHLSVAPFLDYYWFMLKTRRVSGYSMTMGVTIGFSRLWKPQYERF